MNATIREKFFSLKQIKIALSQIRGRFKNRTDTEHEQAFIRLIIGVLLFFYFSFAIQTQSDLDKSISNNSLVVTGLFILITIGIIAHIVIFPRSSVTRRLIASTLDSITITSFFFNASESAISLYFLYLWVIFGHGFRYGRPYLFYSLFLSLLGFGIVIVEIPYWQQHKYLGSGLWFGMFFVSMYVASLIKKLTTALENAEAANQAKRKFISSISHELRTPLNAIIGMTELLRSTALNSPQEEMLYSLDNASKVMLTLIEDVLDFSKIEAGKLNIEHIPFDLYELTHNTADIFKYQAAKQNLNFITFVAPSIPSFLYGDPYHLRQIFVNLLSNAIKFTKTGNVIFRVMKRAETEKNIKLRFEVEDTGIGIAAEDQEKIFESFTQAHDSISVNYGGTGLGTTISKQLAELMGGCIGLESQLEVGSKFWCEFDFEKKLYELHVSDLHEVTVLLVELDTAQLSEIGKVLNEHEIRYKTFENFQELFSICTQREFNFSRSIVLFGNKLLLEKKDDFKAAKLFISQLSDAIRSRLNNSIPIIVSCNHAFDETKCRQLAEFCKLTAMLDFPLEMTHLINALHSAKYALMPVQRKIPALKRQISGEETFTKQPRVLVAEDNQTNRMVIEKILLDSGYRCRLVINGEEALEAVLNEEFDAIILDMNMPVLNGIETTKAFRFMQPHAAKKIPIIIFSANVTSEAKEECIRAGADEFLPKPIQVTLFINTLQTLIKKHSKDPIIVNTEFLQKYKDSNLSQNIKSKITLNYATLIELEEIAQTTDFVTNLIAQFTSEAKDLLKNLESAFIQLRIEEAREILHALAGASISVGAEDMSKLCSHYETMSHADLRNDKGKIIQSLLESLQEVRFEFEQYQSRN